MNAKTKDRLLTIGALGLICLGGFSTSGCAVTTTEPLAARTNAVAGTVAVASLCTTDLDCELQEKFYTERVKAHLSWKKVAAVAIGVVIAGYLYNRQQRKGETNQAATQPYDCGFVECRPVK